MEIKEYFCAKRKIVDISRKNGISRSELELLLILGEKNLLPSEKNVFEIDAETLNRGSIGAVEEYYRQFYPGSACSTIQRIIKNLKSKGFVKKEINPCIERKRYLELTKGGKEVYDKVKGT